MKTIELTPSMYQRIINSYISNLENVGEFKNSSQDVLSKWPEEDFNRIKYTNEMLKSVFDFFYNYLQYERTVPIYTQCVQSTDFAIENEYVNTTLSYHENVFYIHTTDVAPDSDILINKMFFPVRKDGVKAVRSQFCHDRTYCSDGFLWADWQAYPPNWNGPVDLDPGTPIQMKSFPLEEYDIKQFGPPKNIFSFNKNPIKELVWKVLHGKKCYTFNLKEQIVKILESQEILAPLGSDNIVRQVVQVGNIDIDIQNDGIYIQGSRDVDSGRLRKTPYTYNGLIDYSFCVKRFEYQKGKWYSLK